MASRKIFNNLLPNQRFVTQKETPKCFAWKMASQSETKEFEYWPDIPSKFFNILFSEKKSCYQCVLKMWAHLISLGSVWYWPCLLLFIKRPLILKRVQTKDKTFRCYLIFIYFQSQSPIFFQVNNMRDMEKAADIISKLY